MSGLTDSAAVAARLPSRQARETTALHLIEQHLQEHGGYVAWSGGKDSTVALHLTRRVNPHVPVVWFDSGLEFPETREYIQQLTDEWHLPLHIIKAQPDALTLLRQSGGWHHGPAADAPTVTLHEALITEPARQAHERYGDGEITGLRAGESVGRRIQLAKGKGRYVRKDGTAVAAPIWRWEDAAVEGYMNAHRIPENPVYARLKALGAPPWAQRVGLVVDYNGAEVGRFTWLRTGWPHMWTELVEALPRLSEWR